MTQPWKESRYNQPSWANTEATKEACSFLNAHSRQLQPAEKRVPETPRLTYTAARGAVAVGRGDIKHGRHSHLTIHLRQPREAERKSNSLRLPNELTCEPYDCSRRIASAHTGLQ
ncbi:hypothetical protein DPX16_15104 [Anabarilius grahami]|uniref:Uncharacterized protein n=1 Tax=Anabarilius grahami TaxID=495550 RepID=A0A3N0YXK2_ANAGA|nr:hypothetical protein DPX16_15104 [Anabarilius grahami]